MQTPHAPLAMPDLSKAIDACGTDQFQTQLCACLAAYLGAGTCGVMQYSRYAIPYYLVRDAVPEDEITLYLQGAYRFDPFYRHWRETEGAGLVWLGDLSTSPNRVGDKARDYILQFHHQTGMVDEIALLCPKLGGAVDNYFFLRNTPFTAADLDPLRALFASIQSLHRLNQRLMLQALGTGANDGPGPDAFAITDSAGRQSFASRDWQQLVGQDIALSDAVEKSTRRPGHPVFLDHAHVVTEALDADFAPAPGGRITLVVQRPRAAPSLQFSEVLDQLFADRLTGREISICSLALRGFPTALIAERLGIAVGTVKNHRKSIYRKLDITTERELFLLLLSRIGPQDNDA